MRKYGMPFIKIPFDSQIIQLIKYYNFIRRITMDIGKLLKDYREKNNLTQENVANYLNISRQAISAWENNLSRPDLETLLLLSNIYKVSLNKLIGQN